MSRLAPPTIMLTAAILLAGCATPDVPTMPNADLGAQARVPGAANFGALVERFPTDFEITWDSGRNVTWTLGLVNPISDLCDPTADVQSDHSSSSMSVTTPNGARHIRTITGGQVTFALYEGTPESADLCTAAVLATGKAVSTTTFSDQLLSGTGTTSFGRRVTGIVTLTDGTRAHLLIVEHLLVHADQLDDDPINPIVVVDKFELRPIGQP